MYMDVQYMAITTERQLLAAQAAKRWHVNRALDPATGGVLAVLHRFLRHDPSVKPCEHLHDDVPLVHDAELSGKLATPAAPLSI